ncbi:MAG: hypothetical protein KCHDKBKB_01152 [Elusimicrobia bacterium]|nr:hypothetical protein [Elusimicrobiota bacterium]
MPETRIIQCDHIKSNGFISKPFGFNIKKGCAGYMLHFIESDGLLRLAIVAGLSTGFNFHEHQAIPILHHQVNFPSAGAKVRIKPTVTFIQKKLFGLLFAMGPKRLTGIIQVRLRMGSKLRR